VWHDVVTVTVDVGQQRSYAQVKGGITEAHAQDTFNVHTTLNVVGLTLAPSVIPGLWFQGQTVGRQVSTSFEIPSDGTKFELSDQSRVFSAKSGRQFALGFDFKNHVSAAVAYIHVPQRVSMPRFLVGYQMPVGRSAGGAL
jgi:hypothetical protein